MSLFSVETQTSPHDRRSLLLLQNIVASYYGERGYKYFEIGSHLGGSILPHLLDERCQGIVSLDARTPMQPDERGVSFRYKENTTAAMMGTLAKAAPQADLGKIRAIDGTSAQLTPAAIGMDTRLVLIDGEHTNRAAFADFVNVLRLVGKDVIIAFHDANLLVDAIWNVPAMLSFLGRPCEVVMLPDVVCAVALGDLIAPTKAATRDVRMHAENFYQNSKRGLVEFHQGLPKRPPQQGLGVPLVMKQPAADRPAEGSPPGRPQPARPAAPPDRRPDRPTADRGVPQTAPAERPRPARPAPARPAADGPVAAAAVERTVPVEGVPERPAPRRPQPVRPVPADLSGRPEGEQGRAPSRPPEGPARPAAAARPAPARPVSDGPAPAGTTDRPTADKGTPDRAPAQRPLPGQAAAARVLPAQPTPQEPAADKPTMAEPPRPTSAASVDAPDPALAAAAAASTA
ncbi:hypothetical protein GCM10010994_09520 [Chelatococcus reniformis]|uniref:Uncharacterized protein n=1 Tax=Chelatococcus reniformis TaxID=1494448 RepID=A0A916X8S4_9HYPH|nr:hypothetical protein GCM10010994_09520 [Chelatococcus reniformis]